MRSRLPDVGGRAPIGEIAKRVALSGSVNWGSAVDILAVTMDLVAGRPVLCRVEGDGYFQNNGTGVTQTPTWQPYVNGVAAGFQTSSLPQLGQAGAGANVRIEYHSWLLLPSELPPAGGPTKISLRGISGGDGSGSSHAVGDQSGMIWMVCQL